MDNEEIKIISLKTLQLEKQRLRIYTSFQEELIKNKISDLNQNLIQFIGEQFLPFTLNKNKNLSTLIDIANDYIFKRYFNIDLKQKNRIINSLIKLSEVMIIRFLFKKK